MKKRLLAMLLVLMMVVSLLPTGALADTNSDSEYISIDYAKDGGITSALTVIVNGPDGTTLDTIGPFDVYRPSYRMTVSIKDEYIGVYEFDTCAINTDGGQSITGWGAADDTAIKQDFSYNIYKDEATITITLKNAENTLSLRNEEMDIDIGTITYLPGSEDRADINIYLNYQPVCAFEDVGITGTRANNFVIRTNDGFYYGDAQNNIIGAALSGNMLTFGAGDDHTVDLYFFTYDDGFDVDFERTVNLTTPDIDDACPSLDISFTYGGEDYSITYDEWNAIGAIYLPKGTDIHVSPDIQEHYGFNFWMDSDTWTEGNVIYTVDAEGNLTDTSPRSHSQDMVINYSATGFNRALIYLRMNSGTNVYPFYTVSYDANGGIGSMSDQTFAEYYVYIKDNEFTKEGCEFVGWNTAADGSGTEYAPNTQYSDKQDLTLYAQWKDTSTGPDDPEPEEPDAPDQGDLTRLDLAVYVDCVNESATHNAYSNPFHLRANENCTVGEPVQENGVWTSTITIASDKFVTTYSNNDHTGVEHQLADGESGTKTITLTWDENDGWTTETESVTFSVKCDTPEQQTQPVMLFIYQNGDTENAVKTIKLADVVVGGQYSTTVDALDEQVNEHYTPGKGATGEYVIEGYYNDGGWNQYRAGKKDNKLDLAQPITVNDGWYKIHVMVTDYEKVQIVIYRDGDTVKPYKTIALENMLKGEILDTTNLDINDYYTPHKAASGFEWEGWFNDGAWNKYTGADCPKGYEGLDEIYINGWTNVKAMVWDQFPVYYSIVDGDGKVVDSRFHIDEITARDVDDYEFYMPTGDSFKFDGWYEKAADVGIESKKEGLPLQLKKYELYGRYNPHKPADTDLAQVSVVLDCIDNVGHVDGRYNLASEYLKKNCIGDITDNHDGTYSCTIKVHASDFVSMYSSKYGLHELADGQNNPQFVTMTWSVDDGWTADTKELKFNVTSKPDAPTVEDFTRLKLKVKFDCIGVASHGNMEFAIENDTFTGEVEYVDGVWKYAVQVTGDSYLTEYEAKYGDHNFSGGNVKSKTLVWDAASKSWKLEKPSDDRIVFDVKCVAPTAPEDIVNFFGDTSIVKIECLTNKDHSDKYYQLKEGTYRVGDVEWRDGHWVLPITIKSNEYVAEFSYNHALTHTESNETEKTTHSVYWNGTQWTYDKNDLPLVVFDTKCEGIDKPEQVAYDINVEVVNGTAEFKGTNIGAKSVINVYPKEDDNKNVTITFVPEDGFVFDAAYVGNESVDLEDNSYTFGEVTADVTIKVLFKQDSVPITPVTPMPTPGEISDLIKDSITVDCVNGEVAHADKVYGLLDGSLVNVEMTDDTSIKVTLDATVYQARYNTDTETKHSLADGQSATVTFALNYVDQSWRVAGGERPITIKVVCETPVEPDPDITDFSKTLVKGRNLYVYQGLAYPTFYRGSVIVDEGDGVTLLYKITVKGTPGTEFTVRDDSADFAQTGEIPDSGETSFYVSKTFTWHEIRRADELTNTAAVLLAGEVADSDTETVGVDIDWDYNPPVVDDDDDEDEDEDDEVFVPNWLNTTDHYAYIVGYNDGMVKPGNNITRAEVATIFFRLLTDNARARYWSQTNDYTDVAADSWYNNAISTLSNMGIINGYKDGTFKPNASITRAEFTAIATRFFDYEAEYDGAFNDVSARAWYADYVQAAVDMGLVDGYPDGGFHPNSNITRAEAVTIVNRVLNRAPHEDHLLDEDEMNVWPDNVYGAWYYADMQEATNSHDYDWIRVSGERVEEWTEKLPERDWAALEQEWSSSHDA